MQLALLPIPTIGLAGLRLVSASELMPNIAIAKSAPNNLGVYRITNDGLSIIFDASKIKACQAIKLEISKPNFFYEGLSEQEAKDATMTTIVQRGAQGQVTIPRK